MAAFSPQVEGLLPSDYSALRSFPQRLFCELLLPCRRDVCHRPNCLSHCEALALLKLTAVQMSTVQA